MSAHDTLISILENAGNTMNIDDLRRKLSRSGALGFGVESDDVIIAAASQGLISYNTSTETVSLVPESMRFESERKVLITFLHRHNVAGLSAAEDALRESCQLGWHVEPRTVIWYLSRTDKIRYNRAAGTISLP